MFFTLAQIFSWLVSYKYLILFPFTIIEGPIITVIAGFLSSLNLLNLFIAYVVIIFGDLVGDLMYYSIGYYGREKFITKWGKYIGLSLDKVVMMEQQFEKRGKTLLIWGKITHVFGGMILVSAGIAKIKLRDFVILNFLASLPKSAIFLLIGFYFGQAYVRINEYFDYAVLIMFGLGVAFIIIYWLIKKYLNKVYKIEQ